MVLGASTVGRFSLSACMAFRVPSPPTQMSPSICNRFKRSAIMPMAFLSSAST